MDIGHTDLMNQHMYQNMYLDSMTGALMMTWIFFIQKLYLPQFWLLQKDPQGYGGNKPINKINYLSLMAKLGPWALSYTSPKHVFSYFILAMSFIDITAPRKDYYYLHYTLPDPYKVQMNSDRDWREEWDCCFFWHASFLSASTLAVLEASQSLEGPLAKQSRR